MVNPNDVFPRRNLGESDEWGRAVETRLRDVEYSAIGQKQGLSGINRTSASSAQELSRQIVQLKDLFDDLSDLYDAIPKVSQDTKSVSGFGLSPGWTTLLESLFTVPDGATQCSVLATASGQLASTTTTSVITSRSVILISGEAGPVTDNPWYPGNSDFRSIMVPSWSRTFSVTPGQSFGVYLQALADDYTAYGYNPNSYASISIICTFSG